MRTASILSLLLLGAVFAAACERDSALENAAEEVDDAAYELRESAENVGDDIEDAAEELDNP